MTVPEYLPDHPLEPGAPTIRNRLTCLINTHSYTLLEFNHLTYTYLLLCLRCSRTLKSAVPLATLPTVPTAKQE